MSDFLYDRVDWLQRACSVFLFDCDLFSNEIFLNINLCGKGALLKIVFKANVMLSTHIIGSVNNESNI